MIVVLLHWYDFSMEFLLQGSETGTKQSLVVGQSVHRVKSLDAGRPKARHLQTGLGSGRISVSMDRLHVLERTTASATLMKTSSGDVVVSGGKNHHHTVGGDTSMNPGREPSHDRHLKVTYQNAGRPVSETDPHVLTPSPHPELPSSSPGDTSQQRVQSREELKEQLKEKRRNIPRPVRTISMSVADHKFVMDEIQTLAEQIQLDLERPDSDSGEATTGTLCDQIRWLSYMQ